MKKSSKITKSRPRKMPEKSNKNFRSAAPAFREVSKRKEVSRIPKTEEVSEVSEEISKAKQITVEDDFAGQRLDNFLINQLKGLPKTRVYRIIRKGEVRVNKGRIKPDYRIVAGDVIRIPPLRLAIDPFSSKYNSKDNARDNSKDKSQGHSHRIPTKVNKQLLSQILYEDEGMIVLNKPSGMAVHGGSGLSYGVIEALRILRSDCPNLELVHRLDRETSGCLMIAKRRSTLRWLHELLKTGQIEKHYWALVKGLWQGGTAVDKPLQKNQLSSGERMVRVKEGGQTAVTAVRVLKCYSGTHHPKATLVEASPITGRTHQIRVHAESVGNPVAGDEKYGDPSFNREMKKVGLSRLFLHAVSLTLPLPRKQGQEASQARYQPGKQVQGKQEQAKQEQGKQEKAKQEQGKQEKAKQEQGKQEPGYLKIEAPLAKDLTRVLFNLSGEASHD